jgi:hypothetical protein
LEVDAMTVFQDVVTFLGPPIIGGVIGVLIFQILDRLNIFYRTTPHAGEYFKRAAAG